LETAEMALDGLPLAGRSGSHRRAKARRPT